MEDKTTYILGEISTMKYGKLPPKEIDKGKYPIWSGYRTVGYCNEFNCAKGDVIIVARGVGGTGDVKIAKENCYLTNLSIHVKLDCNICLPEYFYYRFLLSNLKYLDSGSAQSQITIDDLKRLTLALPPLAQQYKTVNILRSFDNKIELNNRINHNLEEQARNIFLSYIDCDCVECPFSDLITVGSGGTPRTSESRFWNGDIPFFSPKDVSNSCFTLFTEKLITKDGLNNCNSSLYHENTTFITARGTVGKISLAGVSMAMNQSCFALTSKDNTPYFAYFLTERVVKSLKKKANGAVFDAINSKDILQELVRVPNRDVIFQIEDRIRPYMNSIRFKSIENLYLTDTRDTLLPKLLSGELKMNALTC